MSRSHILEADASDRCAYCGDPADTEDHVFPRAFFNRLDWAGLPTVPACQKCNNNKSALESYLASVLPFGGTDPDAKSRLATMGGRRLAGNRSLRRDLQRGMSRVWTQTDSGLLISTMALPLEPKRLTEFFGYVARGLVRFEFGEKLDPDDYVDVPTITEDAGEPLFRRMLTMRANARANRSFGNGAVVYEGAQGVDDPRITVWLIRIFGGLKFRDDAGRTHSTVFAAMTGPKRIVDNAERRLRWIEGRAAFA